MSQLVGILIALCFIVAVLFVIFGQITFRKLRKNPVTKNELGFEFVSGWDILNVAQALALPRSFMKKLKNSPISFLEADVDVLYRHTNTFDKVLASIFYWLFVFSGLSGALLGFLNMFGVFD